MRTICIAVTGMIIAMQAFTFARHFEISTASQAQLVLSESPCQTVKPETRLPRSSLLLRNCWASSTLSIDVQKEDLFPFDFGRRFRNLSTVYAIANNEGSSAMMDAHDQEMLKSLLSGDEMRTIQGLYFLCAYPTLLSQLDWRTVPREKDFNRLFLESCQQGFTQKTGLKAYLRLSKEEQKERFQEFIFP